MPNYLNKDLMENLYRLSTPHSSNVFELLYCYIRTERDLLEIDNPSVVREVLGGLVKKLRLFRELVPSSIRQEKLIFELDRNVRSLIKDYAGEIKFNF